ncbi:hypothetical protein [Psychrobacter sp. G]|uniref:hypothetical protein n=1 Tax=Psychrobacter sp. G TaxID=571800 RepID=UPI001D0CEEF2|nr:hypothetical protein [Psychrobacter sp. G]
MADSVVNHMPLTASILIVKNDIFIFAPRILLSAEFTTTRPDTVFNSFFNITLPCNLHTKKFQSSHQK